MAASINTYRVTQDDLSALDSKTLQALQPLLDSLNITVPQLTQAVQQVPDTAIVPYVLQVGSAVADSFPLLFKNPLSSNPRFVQMCCVPQDPNHILTTAFVMQGFSITSKGFISIPWITGLLVSQNYNLTFLVHA